MSLKTHGLTNLFRLFGEKVFLDSPRTLDTVTRVRLALRGLVMGHHYVKRFM